VLELLGGALALLAFAKACWNVAEFAISAKKDISTLTGAVSRLEVSLDEGMQKLDKRLLALETKEAIRAYAEHVHEQES
jgi:hypothetical protein